MLILKKNKIIILNKPIKRAFIYNKEEIHKIKAATISLITLIIITVN